MTGPDVRREPPGRRSSLRRRLVLNAGSNWANLGVTTLTGLLLIPFLLDTLGVDAYGVWALLAFGLAYPVILERAFGNAVVRFAAHRREDPEDRNRYVSSSLLVMAAVAAATLALSWLIAPHVPGFFAAVPERLADSARTTTRLVGLTLALNMLQAPFAGALKGEQLFTRYNASIIVANLARTAGVVALAWRSPTIESVQWAYVGGALLALVLLAVDALRSVPGLRVAPALADAARTRELWRFTRHSLARSGSRAVMLSTLALLVGRFGTAGDVALYDVASKVPQFLNSLMQGAQNVLLPVVSEFSARGEIARIRDLARRTTGVHLALIGGSVLLLLFDAEPLLRFWLRREFDPDLVRLVRVLALSLVPGGAFGLWLPTLVGVGKLRALSVAAVAGAIAAVAGAWIAMESFTTPPFAPAWSMLVVFWIYRALWLPAYGVRAVGESLGRYLNEGVVPSLAGLFVAAGLLLGRGALLPDAPALAVVPLDAVLIALPLLPALRRPLRGKGAA